MAEAVHTGIAEMTLADFAQRCGEAPFELVQRVVVPVSPQAYRSARHGFRLARLLADFVEAHGLGEGLAEAPFVLTHDAGWVRGSRTPDFMFTRAARLAQPDAAFPGWQSGPPRIAPDLAGEVVSPTDQWVDVDKKLRGYLRDGVRLVWVLNEPERTVSVFTLGDDGDIRQRVLGEQDLLSGEDVIPGFSVPVSSLFT